MSMRVIVIGGSGMLGHKLLQVLKTDFDVYTIIRSDASDFMKYGFIEREKIFDRIDVQDFGAVSRVVRRVKPEFVINAVGIIKQIPSAQDTLLTLNVNSIFPQRLARIAGYSGFKLINISTDCVFTGKKGNYTERDVSDAVDLYGKSKFLGEVYGRHCLTLRTSIIGRELSTAHSLIEWFLSQKGGAVKGYKNAIYTGFPTMVFAEIISGIIRDRPEMHGIYHVSSDPIDKYELLKLVNTEFQMDSKIDPFEDFYIDRSLNSTKFRCETGFTPLSWKEMIGKMANDPTPYDKWRN